MRNRVAALFVFALCALAVRAQQMPKEYGDVLTTLGGDGAATPLRSGSADGSQSPGAVAATTCGEAGPKALRAEARR
jgi:hypothetical protein